MQKNTHTAAATTVNVQKMRLSAFPTFSGCYKSILERTGTVVFSKRKELESLSADATVHHRSPARYRPLKFFTM